MNHVPRRGDMPLTQTALAPKSNVELAQLLLHHGADPDIKNTEGVSARQPADVKLRTLIDQAKPATAAQLESEDILNVAMALHYEALCDAALPGYEAQVAVDYSRSRIAQATALSQLESSPDFKNQQAAEDELRQQMGTLHRICEASLIEQFRFGTPVSEAALSRTAAPPIVIQPAAATVKPGSVTVHSAVAPPAVGGGMMSHP